MIRRVSLLAVLVASIAGCSGGGGSPNPSPTPTPTAVPTATPTPGPQMVYVAPLGLVTFPVTASGYVAPTTALPDQRTAPATTIGQADAVAVDAAGYIYVADPGNNAVEVFAPGANGNVAPVRRIIGAATGIDQPTGIGVDGAGNVYVGNYTAPDFIPNVTVYAPSANGNAAPIRTIKGNLTNLSGPWQLVVNPGGDFWIANSVNETVDYFAAGANGNVAPASMITNVFCGSCDAPVGLAIDASGAIYVAGHYQINVYAPGASGAATPIRTITPAAAAITYSDLYGLAIDRAGNLYASDVDGIVVFAPGTNGSVVPNRTIRNSNTNGPHASRIAIH